MLDFDSMGSGLTIRFMNISTGDEDIIIKDLVVSV